MKEKEMVWRLAGGFAAWGLTGLAAFGGACFDNALVVGHTNGEKCFYKAGEEMVFTLTLEGVKGELEPDTYFLDWVRSANDGKTEKGRVPASLTEPLVIRTSLDRPGFVKIEANLVFKDGRRVPKKHMWEKRVFFQGGAGVDIDKIEGYPEPPDFDAHWAAERKLIDDMPLDVIERRALPCANPEVNLWHVKIRAPEGYMPCTGYLAIPKKASAKNRLPAHGELSGYYMWGETCPSSLTNRTDEIHMYVNRHGCDGDREPEYYKPFLKNPPYPPDHFRGMALRGMLMFRFLKTLPEWDGKTLLSCGSSGGAMQSLWMAVLVPGITRVDAAAPALGDVYGFKYGRATGDLGRRVDDRDNYPINYYDIANFARRITCPVTIQQGLGDYTCTPFAAALVYNRLRGRKKITWKQGTTHGWWPDGMAVVTFSSEGAENLQGKVGAEELTAGKGNGGDVLRAKEDFAAEVAADVAEPVRPAGVNGQPFWNGSAQNFMYPPSFDFAKVPGAVRYRFTAVDDLLREHTMEAPEPTALLKPLWRELPTGLVNVFCDGVAPDGRLCGRAGSRRFWKLAAFRPGAYKPAARPYAEAAAMACDYIWRMKNTQLLLEKGTVDPDYNLNSYPSKMNASIIRTMLNYAKLRPENAGKAMQVARAAADYLLAISQPAGTPLEYFPPTYRGKENTAAEYAGQNMLLYPAGVASAYLALADATGDAKYAQAAERIGRTYLKLQGDDGTWPLKMSERDGKVLVPNRAIPLGIMSLFLQLNKRTGDAVWQTAADRAFAFIEKGPLTTWNWDAQFEDVKPGSTYRQLTKHNACSTAIYLLERFPGDKRRLAQARELLRFAEDQFVYWEKPCRKDGTGYLTGTPPGKGIVGWSWDYATWHTPGVGEQYGWAMPIDASNDKLIRTYLALYHAECRKLDLLKARALGDALTNIQDKEGKIRTQMLWREDADNIWINCLGATVEALNLLAAEDDR